ncbi:Phospholipase A2 crotoxin acid subunit CA [Porites harrisoni]
MATWGYRQDNGPDTWHKSCPVATGERQSPIDLTDSIVKGIKLQPFAVSYPPLSNPKFFNNGHSVQYQADDSGNSTELSGGPLTEPYKFGQFHFHWGAKDDEGSEHRVNGKMFPAELHLVHFKAKYAGIGEAVQSGDADGLCVLGFFLKVGAENASLKPITDLLPKLKEPKSSEPVPASFDLKAILPSALTDYYTYEGSLTTPPLAQCVKWVVFKNPLEVSAAQMEAFRTVDDRFGDKMVGNYRPPCPLHSRTVSATFK